MTPLLQNSYSLGGIFEQPSQNPGTSTVRKDFFWMKEALKYSMGSIGITNPNPAVGCILVDSNGKLISKGATEAFGGKHAERVAFSVAKAQSLSNPVTAYVTLEPCSHFGKQPPCAELFSAPWINRIVVSRPDLNPIVSGQGLGKIKEMGKVIEIGTLFNETSAWHLPFLGQQLLKRPIFAILASSSSFSAYAKWITLKYDCLLIPVDWILSGTFNPLVEILPSQIVQHLEIAPSQNILRTPLLFIFDPEGKCLTNQNGLSKLKEFFSTFHFPVSPVLYVSKSVLNRTKVKSDELINRSFVLPHSNGNEIQDIMSESTLQALSQHLGRPLQSIAIAGKSQLLAPFLDGGLGDIIHLLEENHSFPVGILDKFNLVCRGQFLGDKVLEYTTQKLAEQIFKSPDLNGHSK